MAAPLARSTDVQQCRRLSLGSELRLRHVPNLMEAIRDAIWSGCQRIELDARDLQFMTEGARRILLTATQRAFERDVDLVLVGCAPFD